MSVNVRIVLVNTTHPGNIGGVARAMKNMKFEELHLVAPKKFPHPNADARASGATDLLERAVIHETLEDAIADCQLVVGTSARGRHIPWPVVDPRELASIVSPIMTDKKVAIVFGREDRGLTNEELHLCHHHVHIPSNEAFSSLNLAAAVQVITYELRMASLYAEQNEAHKPQWGTEWDMDLAESADLERLFEHMEQTLIDIEFLDPERPRQLMPRLRRLYLRSLMDKVEVNVLRGILTATQKQLKK
ncbi:RNA methyltransferase [Neptuniibacter sp. 1_MG-2023]|jgi:tRNA (cytidine32/uridine32-2'-O)-methyltransferase|uniref:RNA methyltransferase n=1 Tax=Neptuniibacter sp. 1_MG-2023 TaxID=3062662 RepID=UPI0026E43757|nr:RNA methyltransferase [Neptuniibacter sp. 1_MG-2023]MDO6594830.1 RNA methyltransferase [Neptuniibacter sp. 1_MG-2023]